MATLGALRAALFPGATVVGGPAAEGDLEAPVGWVRTVRARVPALDALEPGDVVIAPVSALAVVAADPAESAALVDACRAARASALVLTGVSDSAAADAAIDAISDALASRSTSPQATAANLVAFRLERVEAVELERNIVAFLVNARAELEHQAAVLESRLERLALRSGELGALVAEIATSLGRAVALEGPRGEILAVHAPPDVPEAAAAVRAYHSRPAAVAVRVSLPAPSRLQSRDGARPEEPGSGVAAGRLVLLGERAPSDLERLALERITGLLALQLAREDAVRRARDAVRRGDSLPAAGPPWVVLVARQVSADVSDPIETREEVRRRLRLLAPARRLALRGDADSLELRAVVATDADDRDGLTLAGRIAELVGRPVAVSRRFDEAAGRPAAEAEARATLEAIEALPGTAGRARDRERVARADRLAAYRLLGALHNLPDGSRQARLLLAPLLEGRSTAVPDRLRTLRAVLESAGPAEAAAVLGVHRNTVAYRVHAIERLTGWRLSDPDLRLPLAMAVRLVQEEQAKED